MEIKWLKIKVFDKLDEKRIKQKNIDINLTKEYDENKWRSKNLPIAIYQRQIEITRGMTEVKNGKKGSCNGRKGSGHRCGQQKSVWKLSGAYWPGHLHRDL